MRVLLSLILFLASDPASARLIELGGRIAFSEAEQRMVELANAGFREELESMEWRIRIEKRREDAKGTRTDFGGKRIVISITGDVQDPLDFAMSMCHELGHILSHSALVSPEARHMREYVPGFTDVEGECDYFAATKCVPRLAGALPKIPVTPVCQGAPDPARCALVAEAGLRTVNGMTRREPGYTHGALRFGSPTWDMDPVTTYAGYGDLACRLSTYLAGAWCEADPAKPLSVSDASANACVSGPGRRPRCWYVHGSAVSTSKLGP